MNPCAKYTQRIRDIINSPRIQYPLLKNRKLWLQLCSSLDVIEDSDLAIAAYSDGGFGDRNGKKYLAVYGLLQSLFLQQDAVFNLCESLGIPKNFEDYQKLKEIRKVRNESIGHPTKRDRPKPTSYHFISRATLSFNGFQLHSTHANGKSEFKDISIPDSISEQKKYISEILASIITELEKRDAAHKEKFRMKKLTSVFPETLGYHFEKVFEGIRRKELLELGAGNLEIIKKTLKSFQEALAERGIELDTYDPIKYLYEEIEYPINRLEVFFQNVQGNNKSIIDEKTAHIFAFFLRARILELKQIAQEIDEEYTS